MKKIPGRGRAPKKSEISFWDSIPTKKNATAHKKKRPRPLLVNLEKDRISNHAQIHQHRYCTNHIIFAPLEGSPRILRRGGWASQNFGHNSKKKKKHAHPKKSECNFGNELLTKIKSSESAPNSAHPLTPHPPSTYQTFWYAFRGWGVGGINRRSGLIM